jgi:hypothetical protein
MIICCVRFVRFLIMFSGLIDIATKIKPASAAAYHDKNVIPLIQHELRSNARNLDTVRQRRVLNHCVGNAGCFRCLRCEYSCAYYPLPRAHARLRVHRAPGIPRVLIRAPAPSDETFLAKLGRDAPRARMCLWNWRCWNGHGCSKLESVAWIKQPRRYGRRRPALLGGPLADRLAILNTACLTRRSGRTWAQKVVRGSVEAARGKSQRKVCAVVRNVGVDTHYRGMAGAASGALVQWPITARQLPLPNPENADI